MSASLDHAERKRLAALGRLHVLDTPDEEAFDRITRLTARLFSAPVAAVTFIDQGRQWFKSRVGLEIRQIPRQFAFCDLTVRSSRVTVIPDARADPRFSESPLVTGPPYLRFYAGAPLISREGRSVGTIAIADHHPRTDFSSAESDLLADLAAMTVDALEQRLLNAALHQERQMLREQRRLADLIVEGSAEGIFAVDPELRCTLWNRAMVALTGVPAAKILGSDITAVPWPLATDRPITALRSAVAGKAAGVRDETYQDASGGERFFAGHFSPLHDADGALVGAIGFIRDTTVRHDLEDQLRQSQKLDAIGQLTGTVAHDFNNLLTIILGNLDRALPRVQGDARLTRMLEDIATASERGEKLTQQLLAFARRQRLEPQAVDVNALVERTVGMLRRTMPASIELRLDLAPRLLRATCDSHQLEIALVNLALNAQAAMPKGGTLVFGARSRRLSAADLGGSAAVPGQFVMVAVHDSGSGMTEDVKRRAFEPFFTTKSRGQGTGLGLSQVYGFVTQSLGHVHLKSRLGRGTSVELYLPTAGAAVEDQPSQPVADTRQGRGTVLVVEDADAVRALAIDVLQEHGYRVIEACDAEQALRCVREHPEIGLVFSDVVMPGPRNGLDLARELRNSNAGLPVVLTTGYSDVLRDIEREGFALLLKPYRPGQLAQAIEKALHAQPSPH